MVNRKNNGDFMKKRQVANKSIFQVHKRRIQKEEKYNKYDKLLRSKVILQDRRNNQLDIIQLNII
tara:strand:- start:2207 stop:2401 length:195 start_codon:yes stop_codon:yes gene_type:complete